MKDQLFNLITTRATQQAVIQNVKSLKYRN